MTNPEYLLPELLAPLVRNTIFSGNIHHCVQADSTNSIALRGAALAGQHPDDTPEGAVFLAEEQTAGRGRSAHSWHSERGTGIYCSFLLRPPMTPSEALWLSLIAGVAVQDAVRETSGLAADIRWPNDLLINDKKFAGILTEMSSEGNKVHHAVIGIGVNVNQKSFPEDLNGSATSMCLEGGREYSRKEVAAALIRALDREYRALLRAMSSPIRTPALRFEPIMRRVESRSSYAQGKLVHVDEDGGYNGVTDGLDPRGFLRVRTDKGLRIVISGSVRPGGKMLLVLDVGNTNTVLGVYENSASGFAGKTAAPRLMAHWRVATVMTHTVDEYGVLFRNLFAIGKVEVSEVHGIIISSVVPPMDSTLREVCERYFHLKPLFVEPGIKTGMPVLYENPQEVGADRIVNGVAAFEKFGGPCVVVDLGTATTFDAISRKGEYLGGVISPGIGISARALYEHTARLPLVDIRKPSKVIGTNTVGSIQAGLFFGYLGLVDGILERLINELGPDTKVVATGGLASLLGDHSKYIKNVDDLLTLEGLRIIWERNNAAQKQKPAS